VPDSVIVMLFLLAMISMGLVAFDSIVQDKRGLVLSSLPRS
jgi:hypothetical protein